MAGAAGWKVSVVWASALKKARLEKNESRKKAERVERFKIAIGIIVLEKSGKSKAIRRCPWCFWEMFAKGGG